MIALAPKYSKATAHFCQHEQGDRSIPQAIVQPGLSDGEGDHAWVRRRRSKRSYRHEGTRLGDRESKALVLGDRPLPPQLKPARVNECLLTSGDRSSPCKAEVWRF